MSRKWRLVVESFKGVVDVIGGAFKPEVRYLSLWIFYRLAAHG